MKSKKLCVAAMLLLTATTALAQQHIQEAFDALRQDKGQKEVWSTHSVEKEPETGAMVGLEDTYDFVITEPSKKRLVENIRKAFRTDEGKAYTISTGSQNNSDGYISLAVGNGKTGGVLIGHLKGSSWIYACFLDSEDTTRTHRYAYALEWVDNGGKIKGRIAKTYATTLKFRQSKSKQHSITINGKTYTFGSNSFSSGFPFDSSDGKSSEVWLTEFNTYRNAFLKNPEGTAANSYATQIYKLCKDASSLEDVEKNLVITEILKLQKETKDEFIQHLFDMSVERLKN